MKTVSAVDVAKSYLEDRIVNEFVQARSTDQGGRRFLPPRDQPPPDSGGLQDTGREKGWSSEDRIGAFLSARSAKKTCGRSTASFNGFTELALSHRLRSESPTGDIKKLEKLVLEMDSCVKRHGPKVIGRYQDLNTRFHCFFAHLADHRRLSAMLSNLTAQIRWQSYQAFTDIEHMRRSNLEHTEILEAISRRDREKALRLTRLHVKKISRVHKAIAVTEQEVRVELGRLVLGERSGVPHHRGFCTRPERRRIDHESSIYLNTSRIEAVDRQSRGSNG